MTAPGPAARPSRLTDTDRRILAKAREVAALKDTAAMSERYGKTEYEMALGVTDGAMARAAALGEAQFLLLEMAAIIKRLDPEENIMTTITITVTDEVAGRLAALTDPSVLSAAATTADAARDAVAVLVDHAQQGVYRPGAWEREWLCRAFGYEWTERLEPDTRPEMLAGDGRVIFDRPRGDGAGEGTGDG
jgi:hypothetical protein